MIRFPFDREAVRTYHMGYIHNKASMDKIHILNRLNILNELEFFFFIIPPYHRLVSLTFLLSLFATSRNIKFIPELNRPIAVE